MTTRTAPRTSTNKAHSRTGNDQPNWSSRNAKMQALGLSSMDELRHYERYERGTNAQRQRPRKQEQERDHAAHVGNDKQSFLEPLWDYIDGEIGRETAFPKDGNPDTLIARGKQAGHVYAEGDTLTVRLIEREYPVTVVSCYEASARLRYRVRFENGAEMALTQAILMRVRVEPPVTVAPTHLLPAPKSAEYSYAGQVWTGEAAERVQARLVGHNIRQGWKYWMPLGQFVPSVLYV